MKKAIKILSICLLTIAGTQLSNAQQTRKFVEFFALFQLDKSSNERQPVVTGYVTFDATFTGFAERLSVENVQLFIQASRDNNLNRAIKEQGISEEIIEGIGLMAYKIPSFTLSITGLATVGDDPSMIYSKAINLQVSDDLGDFTIPEFRELDKDRYSDSNSWENTGSFEFQVSEIYFKDYDIRIKNEHRKESK